MNYKWIDLWEGLKFMAFLLWYSVLTLLAVAAGLALCYGVVLLVLWFFAAVPWGPWAFWPVVAFLFLWWVGIEISGDQRRGDEEEAARKARLYSLNLEAADLRGARNDRNGAGSQDEAVPHNEPADGRDAPPAVPSERMHEVALRNLFVPSGNPEEARGTRDAAQGS